MRDALAEAEFNAVMSNDARSKKELTRLRLLADFVAADAETRHKLVRALPVQIVVAQSRRALVVEFTRKQIKRGTHRSTKALRDAILAYIALGNDTLRPFV